jgi:hypothetical protein
MSIATAASGDAAILLLVAETTLVANPTLLLVVLQWVFGQWVWWQWVCLLASFIRYLKSGAEFEACG